MCLCCLFLTQYQMLIPNDVVCRSILLPMAVLCSKASMCCDSSFLQGGRTRGTFHSLQAPPHPLLLLCAQRDASYEPNNGLLALWLLIGCGQREVPRGAEGASGEGQGGRAFLSGDPSGSRPIAGWILLVHTTLGQTQMASVSSLLL